MRRRNEQGGATVLVLGCVLASCLLGALWLSVARAGLTRQHAETAADLAAVAAAATLSSAISRPAATLPCEEAAHVARLNGALLQSCVVREQTVEVTVSVSGALTGRAHARAGPSDP